jgi:hypothetical protein
MIDSFNQFLTENIGPTHQERFDRQIYLHFIETHKNFKHVSKEEFNNLLLSVLNKRTTVKSTDTRVHKMYDEIEIWWSDRNNRIGEIWREDDIESYWVNVDLIK